MRCDHCEYRNTWDCEDYRVDNDAICDDFKLDYDTLNNKQKREIQERLMDVVNDYWE